MFKKLAEKFNSLFPALVDKLLLFFVILCALIFILGRCNNVQAADDPSFGGFIFRPTNTGDVPSVVKEYINYDDPSYTAADFLTDLATAVADLYFGVDVGTLPDLIHGLEDLVQDYDFELDTTNGLIKVQNENAFLNDLDVLYRRLGYTVISGHIGNWYPLPITYGNNNIYSDAAVYTTRCTGSGGTKTLFAVRGVSSAVVTGKYIASGVTTNFTVNTAYTGSEYSGCYKDGLNANFNNSVGSYWLDNNYDVYSDNNISLAVNNALVEFFGDNDPVGGASWNGNIFFDNHSHSLRANNIPASDGSVAVNRYTTIINNNLTPSDNIRPYFSNNTNIIFSNPDYSVPLWFSVDPDPDAVPSYDFDHDSIPEWSKTSYNGDTSFYSDYFFDFQDYCPDLFNLFAVVMSIGVATFILRRK